MRLNNRLLKHSPKRGPDELNIELQKIKQIKIAKFAEAIKNAYNQLWDWYSQMCKAVLTAMEPVRKAIIKINNIN